MKSNLQVIESNRPSLAINSIFFFLFRLLIAWGGQIAAHAMHYFEGIKEHESVSISKSCSKLFLAPIVDNFIRLKVVKT